MDKLVVGDTAPAFCLADAFGHDVSLADFASGRVLVYFYPAAMTPGCTREATDFSDSSGDFAARGMRIVGISPDPVAKIAQFRKDAGLGDITLLSNPDKDVLLAYGAYGSKMLYGKEVQGVIRSTFVIDVDADGTGKIDVARYNVRATGHVARLRQELGLESIVG